jgi:hypothetical protein
MSGSGITEETIISKGITFPQHAPFGASMPVNNYPSYVKEQSYTPSSFGLVGGGGNLKSKKKKQIYNILKKLTKNFEKNKKNNIRNVIKNTLK